ncbi:UNVERIFIED_CONTAM: hypothetical protein NCL1_43532 [Trichonephila clavipes]
MPPNTLRVHTEYVLVKSGDPKVLWAESRVQGTGEYFPPLQTHGKIVEIGGVAIYRPFGEFRRANSYCHLYGAQDLGQRRAPAWKNNCQAIDTSRFIIKCSLKVPSGRRLWFNHQNSIKEILESN